MAAGEPQPDDVGATLEAEVPARLASLTAPSLRAVINATGVILHTNLGRAPLAQRGGRARRRPWPATPTSNTTSTRATRGRRDVHAERLLCRLTGAEAAVVVNNNAAATLLALAALAAGREVIVSRGELVEIGGGFRVPDVMAQSGAVLREVGTTNRTRAADYAAAIGDRTAAILRVHPSNFRIEGFTERPDARRARRARRSASASRSSRTSAAAGSASCRRRRRSRDEPAPRRSLAAGADVVLFSGDKLLGGPQAGIIAGAGRADRRDPPASADARAARRQADLCRARGDAAGICRRAARPRPIPVARMLALDVDAIRAAPQALIDGLRGNVTGEIVDGFSTIGGGSAPGSALATALVALSHASMSAAQLEARLRRSTPPVIARIQDGRVVLDLRTVAPEDDATLATILARV